jgi:hypothetical protein
LSGTIRVRIPDDADPTGTIVHRFRNFGEDIFRVLRDICSVDLDEIDRCTSTFCIRDVADTDLPRVMEVIEHELRHHNFLETANLVEE